MQQTLTDPNPKRRLDAALALAKQGNFDGLDAVVDGLSSDDAEVRVKAAYLCERIGFAAAIDPLRHMATHDPVSANRNQAIYALAGIGRPAVVPALITALNDDDPERRDDARTALYRVIGQGGLPFLADEDGTEEPDRHEAARVAAWWKTIAADFDSDRVYSMGELASPGVFIQQLKHTKTRLPDAILNALNDWTGEDFGQKPLSKVISKWEKWWSTSRERYVAGQRYFHSYPVP